MNPKKVEKALSPEEMTALGNIQSILSEIMQMNPEAGMEDQTQEFAKTEDEDDDVEKTLETTASESGTASDDAETRLEEGQTEVSEDNAETIAKAIASILKPAKVEKKKDPLHDVLLEMAKVQKSSQEQVLELSEAFGNILSGLGIAKQIEIAKEEKKVVDPSSEMANTELLKFLKESMGQSTVVKEEPVLTNGQKVHKNLNDRNVLTAMIGR